MPTPNYIPQPDSEVCYDAIRGRTYRDELRSSSMSFLVSYDTDYEQVKVEVIVGLDHYSDMDGSRKAVNELAEDFFRQLRQTIPPLPALVTPPNHKQQPDDELPPG